jgi:hypothetical protein
LTLNLPTQKETSHEAAILKETSPFGNGVFHFQTFDGQKKAPAATKGRVCDYSLNCRRELSSYMAAAQTEF